MKSLKVFAIIYAIIVVVSSRKPMGRSEKSAARSCEGHCGEQYNASNECHCNAKCTSYNNCCDDYKDVCEASDSCRGACGRGFDSKYPCQCNDACIRHNDCCDDFQKECKGGSVTDQDLKEFSQLLVATDQTDFASKISLDYQAKVDPSGDDRSPRNFVTVDNFEGTILTHPTVAKLVDLFDNYDRNVKVEEVETTEEKREIEAFMDAVMDTDVMKTSYGFLTEKGLFSGNTQEFRQKLESLWFGLYDRDGTSKDVKGSSGFEHVFVGEVKQSKVNGLHNWIRYYLLERQGQANYHGYIEHQQFGSFGHVCTVVYDWEGTLKPAGGSLFGTSPEFEMAIKTVCFMAREGKDCKISLNSQDLKIVTFNQPYEGEDHIGTAYTKMVV